LKQVLTDKLKQQILVLCIIIDLACHRVATEGKIVEERLIINGGI